MAAPQQSKNWVFTLNNPTAEEETGIRTWVPSAQAKYIVYQHEVGENGTPHIQGYVQLINKKRLNGMKGLQPRAHWEKRRGTHEEAEAYCTKADSRAQADAEPYRDGVPTRGAGQRNDLLALKEAVDGGASEVQLWDEHFGTMVRHDRAIKRYTVIKRQNARTWHTNTTVYWGPSGTGKSRRALHDGGTDAFWLPKPTGQTLWFDGYDGHKTVVIDEFYGWIARDQLQRMCDRYPLLVQTKGGTVPFVAEKIIITSNQHPRDWWRIGLGAMERRLAGDLGEIVEMNDNWIPPEDIAAAAEAAGNPWEDEDSDSQHSLASNIARNMRRRNGF